MVTHLIQEGTGAHGITKPAPNLPEHEVVAAGVRTQEVPLGVWDPLPAILGIPTLRETFQLLF